MSFPTTVHPSGPGPGRQSEWQQLALLLGAGAAGGLAVGASAYPEDRRLEGAGVGALMGGLSGAGSYGLSRLVRHLQRHQRRRSLPEDPLPGPLPAPVPPPMPALKEGSAKAADWVDQLPRLRLPDTIAGAALGGTAGLAVQGLHRLLSRKKGKNAPSLLRGALTGAALGAAGGNVVGDRLRRFLSNARPPVGYGVEAPDLSLQNIYRAGILDEPAYTTEHLPQGLQDVVAARHELLRRSLGVHGQNTGTPDFWSRQQDDSLSLNPDHPRSPALVRRLLLGRGGHGTPVASELRREAERINQGHVSNAFLGPIAGGQTIQVKPEGPGQDLYQVRDRWDFTLGDQERKLRNQLLGQLVTGGLSQPLPPEQPRPDYLPEGTTGAKALSSLLGRDLVDRVLVHERPWLTQGIRTRGFQRPQPLTGDGQPYPQPTISGGPHAR